MTPVQSSLAAAVTAIGEACSVHGNIHGNVHGNVHGALLGFCVSTAVAADVAAVRGSPSGAGAVGDVRQQVAITHVQPSLVAALQQKLHAVPSRAIAATGAHV